MKYFDEEKNRYCNHFSTLPPQYLIDIERDTILNVYHGKMIVGQIPGRILSMISQLLQPKQILEIGSFTGYSTLSLAEGLGEKGVIDSIEINAELEKKIKKNISLSPYGKKINIIIGDSLNILPEKIRSKTKYDLIFIDGNKKEYPKYLELASQLLSIKGWLIADNTLWSGMVYDKISLNNSQEAKQIHIFNQNLCNDKRYDSLLMPIYDGFTIAKKVK